MLSFDLAQDTGGIIKRADAPRPRVEKKTRWGRGVRMSEMGGCNRKQTLRIAGFKGEYPNAFDQASFNAGNAWEDIVFDMWDKKFPGQVERSVPVPSPFGTGEIDIWIPEIKHLVECKSTKYSNGPYLPQNDHVIQIQLYLHFWGVEHGVESAEITYVLKEPDDESGEVVSVPQEYDEDLATRVVKQMRQIHNAGLVREVMPIPAGFKDTSFPCSWGHGQCAFHKYCWGDDKVS